jgi:hypothetical protein
MANVTRQVHAENRDFLDERERLLREYGLWWEPFKLAAPAKRRYPGQGEAAYLLKYLSENPRNAKRLLKSISILQKLEEARRNKDVGAVHELRRDLATAYNPLIHAINKRRIEVGVQAEGLVVRPETPAGDAALAVLLLEKLGRLHRLRHCRHCGALFYARFKHQWFCPDPAKKCQWNHYHTSEWRRQHRERNKKNQQAYRERLFGKSRKRHSGGKTAFH